MNAGGWRGVHAVDAIAHGDGPNTFADLVKAEGSVIAGEAVKKIAGPYAVEKQTRGKAPDERPRIRRVEAKPVLDGARPAPGH